MKRITLICGITVLLSCGGKTNNIDMDMRNVNAKHIAKTVSSSGLLKQIPSELIEIDMENCVSIDNNEILMKISDIKYIYLKTEEPIGYVSKVIIHKNKIFVVDALSSKKIFIFDMKGNLIKIISDKGGGPQEYLDLGDVVISDEEIIVADGKKLCRLYYTLDGKYIRTEKCLPCNAFALLGDKFILGLITPEQIEAIREYQTEKKGAKDTLDIQNEELRNIINIKDDPNQIIVLYKLDFDK
ncbi:MAG: 6-bladed beta-propeller [Bacteroidales bacterium]|jgi:hypothetical protein|nr:6-bladed beta-propeller [Bacteroidales bacterium]